MQFIFTAQQLLVRLTVLCALAGTVVISAQRACGQEEAGSSAAQSVVPPPPPPRPPQPAPPVVDAADADESRDPGYDVLLQGPVHEAFAAPMDTDLTDAARVYSQAPPDPINEQPPEDEPPEEGTVWIPGYWSWSDDANKYVWVSGLYRRVPPGRVWVEGYWSQQDAGYRWTSGYWARAEASHDKKSYLPVPPETIDNGPSSPPPGEDYFWLPGQWDYVDGDYRWRSGYWTSHYEDWIWQPDCYVDTPDGCVFVDGYWDRLPPRRGMLFAPVDFYSPVYLRRSFVYRPCYPLAHTASLLLHLFVRPGCPHFFYGDFYGPSYASLGFRPWYDCGFGFSPIAPWLRYYDWRYRRRGIDFVGSMGRYHNLFRGNPSLRPPKSLKVNHHVGLTGTGIRPVAAVAGAHARTFDGFVRGKVGGQPFKRVSTAPARIGKPSAGQHAGIGGGGSFGARGLGATSASAGKGRGSRGLIHPGALGSGAPRSKSLGSGAPRSKSLGSGSLGSGALGSGAGTLRSFGSPDSSMKASPSLRGGTSFRSSPSLGRSSTLGRGSSIRSGPSVRAAPSMGRGVSIGRSSSLGGGSSLARGSSSAMRGHGSFKSVGRGGLGGSSFKSSGRGGFGGGAFKSSPRGGFGGGSFKSAGRGGFGGGSRGKGKGK